MYCASPAIKIKYYIFKKEIKPSGHTNGECCLPEHWGIASNLGTGSVRGHKVLSVSNICFPEDSGRTKLLPPLKRRAGSPRGDRLKTNWKSRV